MKKSHPLRLATLAVALVAAFAPSVAAAQVFVYPRRPNKSQVRYFQFEWRHVDILVGPQADTSEAVPPKVAPGETGGVPPTTPVSPKQAVVPGAAGLRAESEGAAAAPPEGTDGLAPKAPEAAPAPPEADGGAAKAPEAAPDGGTTAPTPPPLVKTPGPQPPATKDGAVPDVRPPSAIVYTAGTTTAAWKGKLGPKTGGVRLYFYDREKHIAQRAAGLITDAYRYLVGVFDYVPTKTFPYILYGTYQEFLQTNLFPLQEGVLGVTSPRDLKLTLPYFGDHRMFEEVGTHEMAHQFTIQKIRTISESAKLWGDPLEAMPLWFVEGLAEYYAQRGVDPESEMLVRDIVVNPDFRQGYAMLDFFEDRPYSVLWTYKVGQVRCGFIEETYGRGTLQKIIDQSALLVGARGDEGKVGGFRGLLKTVTGDEPQVISAKFEDWIKRRAFRTVLASEQGPPAVKPLEKWEGLVNSLDASPDGTLLLYRTMSMDTGQSRLVLTDYRHPEDTVRVASDGKPGFESLHPISVRSFDISNDALVFVAESGSRDVLYWQAVRHEVHKLTKEELQELQSRGGPERTQAEWEKKALDVRLSLGHRVRYELHQKDIVTLDSPVFSPDGRRVAFIGLSLQGQKDIYVLQPKGESFDLKRITNDEFAERQLAWGPEGIVYTSDATPHSRYNLFRVDPDHPEKIQQLTNEERDESDPLVLPDGRTLFVAYNHARADVYEVKDHEVIRLTDVSTGLFDLAPGPENGLWALWYHSGQRRPVQIAAKELERIEAKPIVAETEPPKKLPILPLTGSLRYDPFAFKNWELGNLFGYFGAGTGGVYGQLLASATDRMRNHGLLLNLYVLGSFDLTDGYLLYVDQTKRLTWGGGLFQSLVFRVDQTFDNLPAQFTSNERFFGALGSVRWPFNTYEYIQADVSVGGVNYFLLPETRLYLSSPIANGTGLNLLGPWEAANAGTRFQAETSIRLGYDTIRYSPFTGPYAGSSALLEVSTAAQPFEQQVFGNVRIDAEHYVPIYGRTNFFVRGGVGTSYGGRLARQYYLSSFDTLRGVPFGDTEFLLGRNFLFSTAELQFPLDAIIRFILFSNIEGVLAVDFGGVGNGANDAWDHRVLDLVAGVNFGFGPLVFRLHFAKPMNIGAPAGLPNNGNWVTNFSLGWLYF